MDGAILRRHAIELQELAERTREAAARAGGTDDVDWRSPAAERFREVLRREAGLTLRCADLLDDAARAMAVHARAVSR